MCKKKQQPVACWEGAWCYTEREFVYKDMESLLAFLCDHMANDQWPADRVRAYLSEMLPNLAHWKKPE